MVSVLEAESQTYRKGTHRAYLQDKDKPDNFQCVLTTQ
jgi:hypothetical protein